MVVTIIFVSPIPFPVTNPPSTTAIELFKEPPREKEPGYR